MRDIILDELRRHKHLAERAIIELDDEAFFRRPAERLNSVAIVVKHLAGNLTSRWTDFLTSDGEKPQRNRDDEFVIGSADSRTALTQAWNRGWQITLSAIGTLSPADFDKKVTIRGEPHTVPQALMRGLTHVAYHVGQILYIVRWLKPSATWLTIEPGKSREQRRPYLATPD
jgi:uncharacterized damage-inducible protein DinB